MRPEIDEATTPERKLLAVLPAIKRLTGRLRGLSAPVVGAGDATRLAGQLVLIFTGVLGMILRGTDTEAAADMGLRTAEAVIAAVAGGQSGQRGGVTRPAGA